jgi:hypothetical protein
VRPRGEGRTREHDYRGQPQQQRGQLRIITVRAATSLISASRASGTAAPGGGQARLGHRPRQVVRLADQPVIDGALVQAAQRGDQMLGRVAAAPGVTATDTTGTYSAKVGTGRRARAVAIRSAGDRPNQEGLAKLGTTQPPTAALRQNTWWLPSAGIWSDTRSSS